MIAKALWLRPLARRPLRFLATVAGVATGVASVVATLTASRAAVASLTDGVDAVAGQAQLELRSPAGVEEALLGELRDLAGQALFAPVIDRTALCPALGSEAGAGTQAAAGDLLRVLGLDLLLGGELERLELELEGQGDLEAMLLGRGVALPRALADELALAPGDPFELTVRARPVQLEVAGIFDVPRFASVWERAVVVDVGLAQELYDTGGRVDRVTVGPRTGSGVDAGAGGGTRALEGLAEALAARLPPGVEVAPPSDRRVQAERMLRSLEFNLTALSGISVLVGAVLVATTLATSVVQRRRSIALLRSLGASRLQVARTVLAEAGAIGLLGGALGVVGGWLGARVSIDSVRSTVSSIASDALPGTARLEPRWIAAGLGLGLATSLVAALLPLAEATRVPPVQGLAAERPESVTRRRFGARALTLAGLLAAAAVCLTLPPAGDLPLWSLLASTLLMGALLVVAAPLVDLLASPRLPLVGRLALTPLRIAQAALEAGRARAAWAAGAVGIAVALAVSMTTMIGSFRSSVIDWTAATMRSDVYLRPRPAAGGAASGTLDPEIVRTAREVLPRALLDPFHSTRAGFRGERVALGGAPFAVTAQVGGVPFLDGRPSREVFAAALERGEVLVNEPFARRFDVARGERIELDTGAGPIERTVAGVYRDYSNHMGLVVTDLGDFLALQPDEGPVSVAIFLPEGEDPRAAREALLGALAGRFDVDALLNRELRGEVVRVFDRTFAVTVALQLVAAAVALVAVLLVLYALVGERRRELAVVRVLGGSRRQVLGLVLAQAGLLGTAGAAGGLAAGLAVGWVLVKVVNLQSFGWSLDFEPPWGSIGWTVLAVVPASLVAGIGPALATLAASPEEVLRDDG